MHTADASGRNRARPPDDTGHPNAAFKSGPFPFSKPRGSSGVVAIRKPGPIVTGEHHQRVLIDTQLFQRRQNLSHATIYFGNHIPQNTIAALTISGIGDKQRDVGHGVGQVRKKGHVGGMTLTDEGHDPIGESSGEQFLIRLNADHFFVFKKRKRRIGALSGFRVARPHVVRVRNTRELIETMSGGQKRWQMTQVPLSVNGGGVALSFADFSECGLCT